MITAQSNDVLAYLEQLVGSSLAASLGAMLGQKVDDERLPGATTVKEGMWIRQEFSPASFGSIGFHLENSDAIALGHRLLAASGLEGEDDDTALGTLGEVMAQVGGAIASTFSAKFKQEVIAKPLNNAQPSDVADPVGLRIKFEAGDPILLNFCPDATLLAALAPPPAQPTSVAMVPVANAAAVGAGTTVNTRNLDLLLDVEMPVSVSFGRTQLPLKDVIKLTTGSIVELNRAVSEPVDIIVNNCVIAKGEVVVVEGNFGVRIKQIISRQERLNSLS